MGSETEVRLHRIWSETNNRLDTLLARVAENRDVMESLDFAKWLFWSGILELLEEQSRPGHLKVDGSNLRWKCQELQRRCQERFSMRDCKPHIEALQLQSIHEKLNTMAGYLANLGRPNLDGAPAMVPSLNVISGGLDDSTTGEMRFKPARRRERRHQLKHA